MTRTDRDLIWLLAANPLLTEREARSELGLPPAPDDFEDRAEYSELYRCDPWKSAEPTEQTSATRGGGARRA